MRRFLAPDMPRAGEFALPQDESQHLARVLRGRAGDRVLVFDGAGREVLAEVTDVQRRAVRVVVVHETDPPRPARAVELVCALPKGERLDWLVAKTTECGAAAVRLAVFERSARRSLSDHALHRLRRVAAESAKQCGRATLPVLTGPRPLADCLAGAAAVTMLADPTSTTPPAAAAAGRAAARLVVGPEGGLSDRDRSALAPAAPVPVGLGPLVLRVETAAVVGVHALVAHASCISP